MGEGMGHFEVDGSQEAVDALHPELASLRAENERLLEQLETVAGQRRQLHAEVTARVEQNNALRGRVEKMAADVDRCVHAYRGPSSSFESAKLETYTDIQTRLRSLLSVPGSEDPSPSPAPDFEGGEQ